METSTTETTTTDVGPSTTEPIDACSDFQYLVEQSCVLELQCVQTSNGIGSGSLGISSGSLRNGLGSGVDLVSGMDLVLGVDLVSRMDLVPGVVVWERLCMPLWFRVQTAAQLQSCHQGSLQCVKVCD